MNLKKTKGIVLNQFKYSESSLIVNVLTEEYGKMSFIINGVRKKKSKIPANYFQAFNILQIVYLESKKSDLHKITEVNSDIILNNIIFDIHKSAICMFLAEIVNITNQAHEKDEKLYQFLKQLIQYIDEAKTNEISNIHLWAVLRLMQFNGISPDNNYSTSNPYFNPIEGSFCSDRNKNALIYNQELSVIIHKLLSSKIESSSSIKINRKLRNKLLNLMIEYFTLHIDGFRKTQSLDILSLIFE